MLVKWTWTCATSWGLITVKVHKRTLLDEQRPKLKRLRQNAKPIKPSRYSFQYLQYFLCCILSQKILWSYSLKKHKDKVIPAYHYSFNDRNNGNILDSLLYSSSSFATNKRICQRTYITRVIHNVVKWRKWLQTY